MGKPYSNDLRGSVIRAIEAGHTYPEVAELCGVSVSPVSRFLTRWRSSESVEPEKFGGSRAMLAEIQARLAAQKVIASQTSVFRFLRHLNLTFKKVFARPSGSS